MPATMIKLTRKGQMTLKRVYGPYHIGIIVGYGIWLCFFLAHFVFKELGLFARDRQDCGAVVGFIPRLFAAFP